MQCLNSMKTIHVFFPSPFSQSIRYDEIPADFRAEATDRRQELVECVANADEIIGEMFLEEKIPTNDDLKVSARQPNTSRSYTVMRHFQFDNTAFCIDLSLSQVTKDVLEEDLMSCSSSMYPMHGDYISCCSSC